MKIDVSGGESAPAVRSSEIVGKLRLLHHKLISSALLT